MREEARTRSSALQGGVFSGMSALVSYKPSSEATVLGLWNEQLLKVVP